ncbi:MAG: hypothetical protein CMI35_10810 [Owenweeksia sp.]|nr:hypothetical protein [Owenweeksia sp.]
MLSLNKGLAQNSITTSTNAMDSLTLARGCSITNNAACGYAFGNNAHIADSIAFAFGDSVFSEGKGSLAIGLRTLAKGEGSAAIGINCETGENAIGAIALGNSCRSLRYGGFSAGGHSEASGINAIAIGSIAKAGGQGSVAIGNNVTASQTGSVVIGAYASDSTFKNVFVFNDGTLDKYVGPTASNQVVMHARNGFRFLTDKQDSSAIVINEKGELRVGNSHNGITIGGGLIGAAGGILSLGGTVALNGALKIGGKTLFNEKGDLQDKIYQSGDGVKIENDIISARHENPLWNARKLHSISVSDGVPEDGMYLQYHKTENIWQAAYAPWMVSDNTLYTSAKKAVGIGTSQPAGIFEIRGSAGTGYDSSIVVGRNGNMSIGCNKTDSTFALTVKGEILADAITLSSDWADYVFEDNYNLMGLDELQNYIQKHGHLPGIPTTGEIRSEGLQVAQMQVKMMEKIEELTLYVLQLHRENKGLKELLKQEE